MSTPDNVAELLSIVVTRNNSEVASVTAVQPVTVKDTISNNIKASGTAVNSVTTSQGFLEITWENPTANQLDGLECHVTAVDQSGHNVTFSRDFEFDITEPSIIDVVAHVAMLEKERACCNSEIKQLKDDNIKMKATIANLQHIETGRVCEISEATHTSGIGERVKTYAVQFKKAYTKPPKVVFGTVHMDTAKEFNLRYTVWAENIRNDGFDTKINTWADTRIYGVCADWVSFPQESVSHTDADIKWQ